MKTFYYPLGHEAGKTMTVAELRAKLSGYPDDMPVFGGWEGVWGYVEPQKFQILERYVRDDERCRCLVIDVENY